MLVTIGKLIAMKAEYFGLKMSKVWCAGVAHIDPQKVKSESESVSPSVVSDSLQTHGLYVAGQVPLSMGFPRQDY